MYCVFTAYVKVNCTTAVQGMGSSNWDNWYQTARKSLHNSWCVTILFEGRI